MNRKTRSICQEENDADAKVGGRTDLGGGKRELPTASAPLLSTVEPAEHGRASWGGHSRGGVHVGGEEGEGRGSEGAPLRHAGGGGLAAGLGRRGGR